MLSHNELNGIQMHANHDIMTEHFRNRLGYEGFFASDLGNIEAVPAPCNICVHRGETVLATAAIRLRCFH